MAALLITRQVVGNLKESLLPYLKKQFKLAKMSFDLFGALSPSSDSAGSGAGTDAWSGKEDRKKTDGGSRQVSQVEVEGSTPQYDGTFDDYLEMFIQFGYVTLFR